MKEYTTLTVGLCLLLALLELRTVRGKEYITQLNIALDTHCNETSELMIGVAIAHVQNRTAGEVKEYSLGRCIEGKGDDRCGSNRHATYILLLKISGGSLSSQPINWSKDLVGKAAYGFMCAAAQNITNYNPTVIWVQTTTGVTTTHQTTGVTKESAVQTTTVSPKGSIVQTTIASPNTGGSTGSTIQHSTKSPLRVVQTPSGSNKGLVQTTTVSPKGSAVQTTIASPNTGGSTGSTIQHSTKSPLRVVQTPSGSNKGLKIGLPVGLAALAGIAAAAGLLYRKFRQNNGVGDASDTTGILGGTPVFNIEDAPNSVAPAGTS